MLYTLVGAPTAHILSQGSATLPIRVRKIACRRRASHFIQSYFQLEPLYGINLFRPELSLGYIKPSLQNEGCFELFICIGKR